MLCGEFLLFAVVILVKVKMVKIDFGNAVIVHYSINIFIYIYTIVSDFDGLFSILTKMTMTTLTATQRVEFSAG